MLTRRLAPFIAAFSLVSSTFATHAQDYTKIVVFGDSLSDTGNDADLSGAKYGLRIPGLVADYTDGRFTDGDLTFPASYKYAGVWVEQLAARLPHKPAVKDSLDGGSDYAYGFAKAGAGTGNFTFGPSNIYSVTVDNVGLQIFTYLSTHPKIDRKTLFIVWAGANDTLDATKPIDVTTAAIQQALNVELLIEAGATQFIVPNLPPLGAIPLLNGSPLTSIPGTQAAILFNSTLAAALAIVQNSKHGRDLSLFQLDVFSVVNKVLADPAKYGLSNVTASAQGLVVNPDQYLFWDYLHPTTYGHHIVAEAARKLITAEKCKELWYKTEPCSD